MQGKTRNRKRKLSDNEIDVKIDRFAEHFETNFDETFWSSFTLDNRNAKNFAEVSAIFGELKISVFEKPESSLLRSFVGEISLKDSYVKKSISKNWPILVNSKLNLPNAEKDFTPIQQAVWKIIQEYVDFYCPLENLANIDEFRSVYSLHVLNHALKGRQKILKNNFILQQEVEKSKSSKKRKKKKLSKNSNVSNVAQIPVKKLDDSIDSDEKFRDQGFARPRILILTPFRSGALKIVDCLSTLLFGEKEKSFIKNRQRFYDEYGQENADDDDGKIHFPRPADFKELFAGNTDDCFRLGLSVAKNSLILYAEFYKSDIIIASPLGIRSVTGAAEDKDFDVDFLSSIEILILDQCDIFLMQNWSHVLHVMENLNKIPVKPHDADFNRIRRYAMDGKSKFYRQTLLFSSLNTPETKNIFSKFCRNFDGLVAASPNYLNDVLSTVTVNLPQAFYRFESSQVDDAEKRFEFFQKRIFPQFFNSPSKMRKTMIFVPSYFDFVRLRNFLKKQEASFVQICEYADDRKVSRARDLFFHSKKQFLLFTERFHFFKRYKIRGVRNLVFYQLPLYPQFYGEICNMVENSKSSADDDDDEEEDSSTEVLHTTCTVIFSKIDALRLAPIVGNEKAKFLLSGDDKIYMLDSKCV